MSFFARLFSAPDEVAKVTDAVIAAGDKLVFTEEERSDVRQATQEWLLRFWESSKGGEMARRLLALLVTGTFLSLVVVAAALISAGSPRAAAMLNLIGAAHLPELVGGIWLFYFGHGVARRLK